jgi:hypothetical protein
VADLSGVEMTDGICSCPECVLLRALAESIIERSVVGMVRSLDPVREIEELERMYGEGPQ